MSEPSTPDAAADPFAGPEWGSGRVRVRRRRKKHPTRRRILIGTATFAALVIAAGLWLAWNALHARAQLQLVRAEVTQLQAQVSAGDLAGARSTAADLRTHADAAAGYVDSPVWHLGEHVPFVGARFASAGALTTIVDHLAQGALPRLVDAADVLSPSKLRAPDGSIDLVAIARTAPRLAGARTTLTAAATDLAHLSGTGWASFETARTELLTRVLSLDKTIGTAQQAAMLAPPLLGEHGPKSYLVTFQNDAEMRTTGGMPGAFAIVRVDHGRFRFTRFESDNYLVGTPATGVNFGRGYDQLYGTRGNGALSEYRNTNLSPNFPYAAQLWLAMWKHKTGQQLDGALTLDPTALSYLLTASGPATLPDGSAVSASNVVADTESSAYRRFAHDNAARKQYLLDIARAVSHKIVTPGVNLGALVHGAAQAVTEQRLLLWTRDAGVEAQLAKLPIGGAEPQTDAPYFRLALWNSTGSKLDYYLHASLDWVSTGCGATRRVTVTVRLTNDAPAGLPPYVTGGTAPKEFGFPPGDEYLGILAYATHGARLVRYTVDGHASEPAQLAELGHPVWSDGRFVPRGQTVTLVYRLTEPASGAAPIVPAQPMVNPMRVQVDEQHCS